EQVFQFIQEYTGLVSPGITAMFVLGLFWKRTTARAAWIAVLITLPVPVFLKWVFPAMPFLDNMLLSFLIICIQMILVSLFYKSSDGPGSEWSLPEGIFTHSDRVFKGLSIGIVVILIILYSVFW
ncbi:MAG: hypothetical protein Q8O06_12310, partial [Acetobacterium sp.]|nr:hypothetical protein [Acetobacterium sp.]